MVDEIEEKPESVQEVDMVEHNHPVVLWNPAHKTHPLGIAFSDENGIVTDFVALTLHQANEFGEIFCKRYNEALERARNEQ